MKVVGIIKDAIILFIISLILVTFLSATKVVTQKTIDEGNLRMQMEAYMEVCPNYHTSEAISIDAFDEIQNFKATLYGDKPILKCFDENSEHIGYIVNCTVKGFNGPLNLIVGFDKSAVITGVRYATVPNETPGLGMKTTESWFLDQWVKHSSETVLEVDTISGATISSSAFKDAVTFACAVANVVISLEGR